MSENKKRPMSPAMKVSITFGAIMLVVTMGLSIIAPEYPDKTNEFFVIIVLCLLIAFGLFIGVGVVDMSRQREEKAKAEKAKIVKTKLLAVNGVEQTRKTGVISGALAGGFLAGGLGAIIGAMTGTDETTKVDNEFTFLILYDDGERKVENVKQKEQKERFELLVSKLDLEDEKA